MEGRSCTNCMLFLVYGLPASGKTSLCRQLCSSGGFAEAVGITHSDSKKGHGGREFSQTLPPYPCRQVQIHHVCFDAIERKLSGKLLTQGSVQRVASLLAGQCEDEFLGWPHQSGHAKRDHLLSLLLGPKSTEYTATAVTPPVHLYQAVLSCPTATGQLSVEAREKRGLPARAKDSWRANVDSKWDEGDHEFSPTPTPQVAACLEGAQVSAKPRQGDGASTGDGQDAETTRDAGQRTRVPRQGGQLLQAHVVEETFSSFGANTEEDKPLPLPCTAQRNKEGSQTWTAEYEPTKYGPPSCHVTEKRSTRAGVDPERKKLLFNRALWRLARRVASARVESLVEAAVRSERAAEKSDREARVQCKGNEEDEGERVAAQPQGTGKPDDKKECEGGTDELDQATGGFPRPACLLGERRVHKANPAGCVYCRSGQDGRESSIGVPHVVGLVKRLDAGEGRSCTGREIRERRQGEELWGNRQSDGYSGPRFAFSSPLAPVSSLKEPRQGSPSLRPSPSLHTSACRLRRSASSPPYLTLSSSAPHTPAINTSGASAGLSSRGVFNAPFPRDLHVILIDDTMHLGSMRKEYFRLATKCG